MKTKTIKIPIESHFAGDYRLEYDGKYITLFGKDRNFVHFKFNDNEPDTYEEMVLISCVEEIRKASPEISNITEDFIFIELHNRSKI